MASSRRRRKIPEAERGEDHVETEPPPSSQAPGPPGRRRPRCSEPPTGKGPRSCSPFVLGAKGRTSPSGRRLPQRRVPWPPYTKRRPAQEELQPRPRRSAMGAAGSSALARLGLPMSRLSAQPRPGWLGVAALGLAAVALGAVAWRRALPRRRRRLQQVGTVARLWIYPVKSCKGVPVTEAECTAMGLRSGHLRDRFWLVIDAKGTMVTARQEPRLVLISLTCDGDFLMLSAAYTKDLLLPIKTPTTNPVLKCRVRGLEIMGRDCGEAAAQWITSFLNTQPYRLVHFEPHMPPRNSHQIMEVFGPTDQVAYADTSPFLVLSEASLADLNSRLEKKVKANNFRPNILISGCGVYAEDSWDEILIGDVELKRVVACSRCILTTVDPDTGIMSRKEPLETLKRTLVSSETCSSGDNDLEADFENQAQLLLFLLYPHTWYIPQLRELP